MDELWRWMERVNQCIIPNTEGNREVLPIHQFVFVKYITSWLGNTVRKTVKQSLGDDAYARLFQRYGQMIRFYGYIPPYDEADGFSGKKDIFAIPRKINQHIKVLRHPFDKKNHRPVRIVVDSIKNVFEAVYLRYRYSAFYTGQLLRTLISGNADYMRNTLQTHRFVSWIGMNILTKEAGL